MTVSMPFFDKYCDVFFRSSEFRKNIRQNTVKGFLLSQLFLISLLMLAFLGTTVVPKVLPVPPLGPPVTIVDRFIPAVPESAAPVGENNVGDPAETYGCTDRATNNYIGVEANMVDTNIKIASYYNNPIANAKYNGNPLNNIRPMMPARISSSQSVIETKPTNEGVELDMVEIPPDVNIAKLQSSVVYPLIAIKAKVEGKVVVRVLIGIDGKAKKSEIVQSDSRLLDDAAVKAIMNFTYKPAEQNNNKVSCWIAVPIIFKLN